MSEHKILDAVTGGLIGVLHLNEDGQTITSPITGKLNYYITPPIPFGGSSDLSEYAKLSAANSFSVVNTFSAGISMSDASGSRTSIFSQGNPVGNVAWLRAGGNSFAANSGEARGQNSFACASGIAVGVYAYAEGVSTSSGKYCSHVEGRLSRSLHDYSHVEGYGNESGDTIQHVAGKYCSPTTGARVTGGGTSDNDKKNIEVLDWQGNLTIAGDLAFTPAGGTATTLSALIARIEALEQSMN